MRAPPKRFQRRSAVETLRAVLEHVPALEDEPEDSARANRWAREQHAAMQARIAELRRQYAARKPGLGPPPVISAEIRTMTREQLLARLEALEHSGTVQYAHRRLTTLTDDDLRQMLAVLLADPTES